jgi:NAD(P)H-dependent flavin oxidoreductase YrpB (nitropropane dioxygenase family)
VISGRACRYIRNAMIDDLTAAGLHPLPVPAQQSLTQKLADAGDREWRALTSGQSAALARATTAAELIERLGEETTARLRAFA